MKKLFFSLYLLFALGAVYASTNANMQLDFPENSFSITEQFRFTDLDTIPPIEDREGDFINNDESNPFDLEDPPSIEKEVEYDPETDQYIITEKLGVGYYREPTYMTYEEYVNWRNQKMRNDYFSQISQDNTVGTDGKDPIDRYKATIKSSLIDRLFGGNTVDIRPNGNIDLTFGADYQKIDNPILTEQQRRNGGFDFDMAIQMNVIGKIGEKLQLSTNYNTQATFDFENQMKLEYTGFEDEIIQKIEAGNVSLPLRGSLISGSQSLFGVKADLRFGRLNVSTVISQKKSKRENVQIQGGTQLQRFEVTADNYDENRHFFLSHFNRDNFEDAQVNLPNINSLFKVTKLEVWITNNRNETENIRQIVAISDLGEPARVNDPTDPISAPPTIPRFPDITGGQGLPDNEANPLFRNIINQGTARSLDNAVATLQNPPLNLTQIEDFEKVRARLLSASEYTFHPELGYLSLNVTLQPEDILGVAFEYTYNGQVHRVGEFTNDIPTGGDTLNVLFVKMLKATTARVDLPIWDLMMKNIYALGAFQVNQQDFKLDIFYQDPGEGEKRFIPAGPIDGRPLISVLNLDNLNSTNDPISDGVFDFVPGITINPRNGRVVFPVLEPFGGYLNDQFMGDPIASQYVYSELYNNTVTVAREFPEFNRFVLKGSYKSSISSEISLGAFNIPRGSVTATAGGQQLVEGSDYEVDYNIGRVRILNDAILNSGVPINVSYEDNSFFGFQQKTLFGTRLDYNISDDINIGGTFMKLSETPFTNKVNIGDDPISNKVYGVDLQYSKEAPWLTKVVDKIPLIQTKEPSNISFTAEGAMLQPGHSRSINNQGQGGNGEKGGVVYLDDFEGSASNYDLRNPVTNWVMASTPQNPRFPESQKINDLVSGINRAKLSWYRIDPVLRRDFASANNDPYTRQYNLTDVFTNFQSANFQSASLFTFDLAYYPRERGSYNFDGPPNTLDVVGVNDNYGVDTDGELLQPQNRWGGIMRSLETNDFEAANIEFVELWMLSPFENRLDSDGNSIPNNTSDGKIYINLGSVSEDILRDSRQYFENGLPEPGSNISTDTTNWSQIARVPPVTDAFDINEEIRVAQDVGLDGFNNQGEAEQFADYLASMNGYISDPDVLQEIQNDPANDDYYFYRDEARYGELGSNASEGIIERYKSINQTQGNAISQNESYTNLPDKEDINKDYTMTETEAYYEYEIPIIRTNGNQMAYNDFVVDTVEVASTGSVWYQLKIPIDKFTAKYGGIQDFRSIRFIRMYMTGFDDEVVFRFARFQLVRNQWRRYKRNLPDPDFTAFDVAAVNFFENSGRQPFPYVLPPGIQQEQAIGSLSNSLQNEQSMSIKVCNLDPGEERSTYKILNFDLRTYKRMKMFVHAESPDDLDPGDVSLFMRLGSDFENNYYEYEIPLTLSDSLLSTDSDPEIINKVWPEENFLDFPLELLRDTKVARNAAGSSLNVLFSQSDPENADRRVSVIGNPDLGLVKGVMIGIRNSADNTASLCSEVWVNELQLSGLDEEGGTAALARLDIQMADFGNISASTNYSSIGWGGLEQKVDQRAKEQIVQYDFATSLELGKFFPQKWGIKVPFYGQYSATIKTPEFDPYQLDITLKDVLKTTNSAEEKQEVRQQAQDYTSIRGFNFTNVRKERMNQDKQAMPWDLPNFSFTYAYSNTFKRDPTIEKNSVKDYRGSIDYAYSPGLKPIEPFKKAIKSKSKWLGLIKDFNFNPLPSSLTFRTDLNRQYGEITYRFADPTNSTYYDKRFFWDRSYGLQWNLSKNLNFSYNAVNNAIIDELPGPVTDASKELIWDNLKDFGRNKNYNQNFSLSYTLPTKSIPLLDWTQIRAQYNGNYSWSAASLNVDTLGNVIQNGHSRQINGDLDFVKLYNKSKYLKKVNSKPRKSNNKNTRGGGGKDEGKDAGKGGKDIGGKTPRGSLESKDGPKPNGELAGGNGKGKEKGKEEVVLDKNGKPVKPSAKEKKKEKEPSVAARIFLRPLMIIRKARASYSEQFSSVVPGFKPVPRLLGMNKGLEAPGMKYGIGLQQPTTEWLDQAAANGWITNNIFLNQQVFANYTQSYDGRLTLEPFRDFRVELSADRSFTQNHSEYFKVAQNGGDFEHLNSFDAGSLSLSFFTLNTMFEKKTSENFSQTFELFETNREVISSRWGELNPRSTTTHNEDGTNYTEGYGRYQQDVLIPAFLSAYTKKDPNTYKLNPFDILPKPNWKLTYNGLSKIPFLSKVFSSVSISHGYKSTMTVNSFRTDLDFDQQYRQFNENTYNYFSPFEIPDLVISESLSPLIGIDMKFKNDISLRTDVKKTRNLALNLTDFQLVEARTDEYTVGFGYRIKGLKLPFKFGKDKKRVLENDLNFKMDFSLRDDKTVNHLLDQDQAVATRGSKTIRISPSIDYAINQKLNLRLFFDRSKTIPATSASFPITNTQAGLMIRFTLSQ